MTGDVFAPALAVANAVLYEGYLLYPYTASAPKNRVRWQFGVVVPRAYLSANTGETAEQQTEVLLEPYAAAVAGAGAGAAASVTVRLRFLHVEARRVEALHGGGSSFEPVESLTVNGTRYLTFDEAVERELTVAFDATPGAEHLVPITIEGGTSEETLRDGAGAVQGRVIRERWPLRGTLSLRCETAESAEPRAGAARGDIADANAGAEMTFDPGRPDTGGTRDLRKLRVVVANDSDVVAGERSGALRTAFVSTHVLLAAQGARFVSVLDPTPDAVAATAGLCNRHVFPVLVGEASADAQRSQLMLSSPIILYDFPAVAPQTDSDAFDGTEIDELLTLSVLSLPDAEREEARATDPRARAIVERAESFSMQDLARVHAGTLYNVGMTPAASAFSTARDPFALTDPFASIDVPALDCVFVDGVKVTKGSSVRLHPKRRADAWDMFLHDKIATVRAIHQDVEDVLYVAVTVDDDPASDLHDWYGRSFFFHPDEVEPLGTAP